MTGGLCLDAERTGRGERHLVFIHGFGASRFTWRFWTEPLEQAYRLHLLDLKGFGRSRRPRDGAYAPRDLADEVVRYIIGEGLEEFVLVGHSMGGGIALFTSLALADLELRGPDALILVGAAAYPQAIPNLISLARWPVLGALGLPLVPARTLARLGLRSAYAPGREPTEEAVEGYASGLRGPRAKWAIRQVAAGILPDDLEQVMRRYPSIDVPTLLLWGDQDRVVPSWVGERLHHDLPESELAVIPGCGHVVPEEASVTSLEILERFLEERFPGRSD